MQSCSKVKRELKSSTDKNTLGSAETLGSKDGHSTRYIPRHLDIQILNSLIMICIFGFIVRFAQLFLNKFSINV